MNKKIIVVLLGSGLLLTACGNEKTVRDADKPKPDAANLIVTITEASTPAQVLATLDKEVVLTFFSGIDKKSNNATVASFNLETCNETGVQFKDYPSLSIAPLGIDAKAFKVLSDYTYVNYQSSGTDFYIKDSKVKGSKFVKNNALSGSTLPNFEGLESIYGKKAPTECNIITSLASKLESKISKYDDTVNFEDKATISKNVVEAKDIVKGFVANFDKAKNTGTVLEGAKVMFWVSNEAKASNKLGGIIIYDKDGKTIGSFISFAPLPTQLEKAI